MMSGNAGAFLTPSIRMSRNTERDSVVKMVSYSVGVNRPSVAWRRRRC